MLTKLHEISSQYHARRESAMAEAEEAIKAEMEVVKKSLGLAGLKATFYDDGDGSGAILAGRKYNGADWDIWDDLVELGANDEGGRLKDLNDKLSELATHLEWNSVDIIV
jgi:hypothetical protein